MENSCVFLAPTAISPKFISVCSETNIFSTEVVVISIKLTYVEASG